MPRFIHYLKLFRSDAALISFFTYLAGASIAGNPHVEDVLLAFLITAIFTNFIYSFNSWTDREIDKINKGYRPIPPTAPPCPSIDMVNGEPALPHSCLETNKKPGEDKFKAIYSHVEWAYQFGYAKTLGLGTDDYELEII